jgi:hypothetical protein
MVGRPAHGQEPQMLRLLFAVIALIAAAMIAGVYFNFNPVILIFLFLGLGLYGVTRIGESQLAGDAPIIWGGGHGIYVRAKDYAPDSDRNCGGEDPREGDGFR